jgi:lipooligosaccharide transport system permease protein
MTAATTPASRRSVRRLDGAAIAGVMSRELTMFTRYWRSTTFSSIVEPTIYLLAFGFGFGALVTQVAGYDYIEFIGTGIVATAVLFSSAFPAMFATFVKRKFQYTYDAILATPVDAEELVTAEVLWIAAKSGVYGLAPLLVAMMFGLDPSPGMLLVPFIGFVTGLGFASFGVGLSAIVPAIDSFNYVISALITPLFLVAGTFFPIDTLPGWARTAAQFNPLYHCVELVRAAVFLTWSASDWTHVAVLVVFAAIAWRWAIARMERVLID